jgi:hypothetical protein
MQDRACACLRTSLDSALRISVKATEGPTAFSPSLRTRAQT